MKKRHYFALYIGILLVSFVLGFCVGNSGTPILDELIRYAFPAFTALIGAVLLIFKDKIDSRKLLEFIGYSLIIFSVAFLFGSITGSEIRDDGKIFFLSGPIGCNRQTDDIKHMP